MMKFGRRYEKTETDGNEILNKLRCRLQRYDEEKSNQTNDDIWQMSNKIRSKQE